VYSFNFSNHPSYPFQLALGSFIEDTDNSIQIIQLHPEMGRFEVKTTIPHTYAPTKIM